MVMSNFANKVGERVKPPQLLPGSGAYDKIQRRVGITVPISPNGKDSLIIYWISQNVCEPKMYTV